MKNNNDSWQGDIFKQIAGLLIMVLAIPTMFVLGIGFITFLVEVVFQLK